MALFPAVQLVVQVVALPILHITLEVSVLEALCPQAVQAEVPAVLQTLLSLLVRQVPSSSAVREESAEPTLHIQSQTKEMLEPAERGPLGGTAREEEADTDLEEVS
jgi:hypothetical protein